MTAAPSPRPVSALRARMIEDMTVRGFNENTRSNYIRDVRAFAAFIRRPPDTATAEEPPALGRVDLLEGEIERFRFAARFGPWKFVEHAKFHCSSLSFLSVPPVCPRG
ncbi:MAG: phage integrase N-terminal SAM-like domain-containing protein [Stellaceae bacterium]